MEMFSRLLSYGLDQNMFNDSQIADVIERLSERLAVPPFSFVYQSGQEDIDLIMEPILCLMADKGLISPDTVHERDVYEAYLMDAMMPSPAVVKQEFHERYSISPEAATNYLFHLSEASNYIKTKRLQKNRAWTETGTYGTYELTINLAKPEKDPKDIAKALSASVAIRPVGVPECVLCKENEQNMHNARMNLRIVPITLGSEQWHLQYSPYQYYEEHAIVLHDTHRPMRISEKTIDFLFDFVSQFPHYFIGSNADLPIVGGSILNHDHFQGGRHPFPLHHARINRSFDTGDDLIISHLDWPMTVIRLTSQDRSLVKSYATKIMTAWQHYNHPNLDILAASDGIPHHTVTLIANLDDGHYILDLVLRDNHTTQQFPGGVFHPHQDLWHIKKENIGLIEVMGLAILPGRLKSELAEIKDAFDHHAAKLANHLSMHQAWYESLVRSYEKMTEADLLREVGVIFERVLTDAGVFKNDSNGRQALYSFIEEALGC